METEATPDGWLNGHYSNLMSEADARAEERTDLPVLSVTKTRGPMLASERFGKVMHGRDLSRYRLAPRNHIVADPMLLWDGSIGIQRVVEVGLVSPDYRVYRPSDEVDPSFLAYLVRSPLVQAFYQGGARGTNVRRNRIAREDFLGIPVSIPPLSEQRKIADIVSSVDAALGGTQAVMDQLQVMKKAMMASMLTRGIPGRHTRFKQTEIGELPESWEVVPLGELLESIESGWSPQCDSRPAGSDEWGVLKVSAVSWGEFRPQENKSLPKALEPRPEIEVKAGDILVTRANTPELVGRSVIVRATRPRLMLCDKILRLRTCPNLADSAYLNLILGSRTSRLQIQDGATGSSRSMKNISQGKLKGVLVQLPSVDEQREIAALIDTLAERTLAEGAYLDALTALKSALMSVLLTGEVRVQPDEDAA